MSYLTKNNAYSTLAGSLTNVATSLTVQAGHGDRFPVVANPDYTIVTIEDSSGNREVVKVTARTAASDVLTIVRAQEGTTARNWLAGDAVELRFTAGVLDAIRAEVAQAMADEYAAVVADNNTTVSEVTALLSSKNDVTAFNAHLNETTDAHDASAISSVASGNLSATNVQAALDELQTDINTRLPTTSLPALTSQAESEAGVENTKYMSSLRVKQSIDVNVPSASATVVGKVELATTAETITTDATRAVTPAGYYASTLGIGQTWQSVTRSAGTTYTNSTGKPIFIAIGFNSGDAAYTLSVDAVQTGYINTATGIGSTIYAIAPNGSTYILALLSGVAITFTWTELR